MKKTIFLLLGLVLTVNLYAQSTTIRIAGTRITYPLFQKWIDEYT